VKKLTYSSANLCDRVRFSRGTSLVTALVILAFSILAFGVRGLARGVQAQSGEVRGQSREEAERKSAGCFSCHSPMDEATMHPTKTVQLCCTDCHV